MKFKPKKKQKRGPAPTVSKNGASLYPLRLPTPFRDRYKKYIKECEKYKVKKTPLSVIFRVGGAKELSEKEKELKAAIKGRFHAKIRK